MSTYRFIDAEKATWPVRLLCRVLDVARSAYYDWAEAELCKRAQEDAVLSVHIRAIHRRGRGTYGSPRVHAELRAGGHTVGRHRVARLMRELDLTGNPKRRFKGCTTDSKHDHKVADNLLNRNFVADEPNRAWVGDITYLPTKLGWVYLAVIIDLFSRKVVGWALETHMQTDLCLAALNQARATRQPPPGLIHHSDRGSQYTSAAYQSALAASGLVPSMSRKGNCWDNAVAESFFGTLEQELGQPPGLWADVHEARRAVSDYIHGFYNLQRRHSVLGYTSPVEFETRHRNTHLAAA